MTLVYFHDLSVKAAAARLGAKPASVSNRIQRALAVIREGGRSAF
jgi:DNA-directed RNA polymerase specialized sigma24 family protein